MHDTFRADDVAEDEPVDEAIFHSDSLDLSTAVLLTVHMAQRLTVHMAQPGYYGSLFEWVVLGRIFCDYDLSSEVLDQFTSMESCGVMLRTMTDRLGSDSYTSCLEWSIVVEVVAGFVRCSDYRQEMLLTADGLIEALQAGISVISTLGDTSMKAGERLLRHYVCIMYSLVGGDEGLDDDDLDWRLELMLQGGSLPAAAHALFTAVVTWHWSNKATRAKCLDQCAYVNCRLLAGAMTADEEVSAKHLTLDRNAQYRMVVALLSALQSNHRCLSQVIYCAMDFGSYLLENLGSDAFAAAMTTKPVNAPHCAPQLLALVRSASWRSTPRVEAFVQNTIASWRDEVPEIVDPILDRAGPVPVPERVVKDRHCARPGCAITGEGLVNSMKKCGRCRAVYYCSAEHQREHWYESEGHRMVCNKWL